MTIPVFVKAPLYVFGESINAISYIDDVEIIAEHGNDIMESHHLSC